MDTLYHKKIFLYSELAEIISNLFQDFERLPNGNIPNSIFGDQMATQVKKRSPKSHEDTIRKIEETIVPQ